MTMSAQATTIMSTSPALLTQVGQRSHRVVMLLGLVFVLSLGDLYSTMTIARSIGMFELNPIARYLLASGNTAALVLYKLGTVGIAVGLLLKLRHHRMGEVGTWVLVILMTGITLYWHQYSTTIAADLGNASYHEMSSVMEVIASAEPGS